MYLGNYFLRVPGCRPFVNKTKGGRMIFPPDSCQDSNWLYSGSTAFLFISDAACISGSMSLQLEQLKLEDRHLPLKTFPNEQPTY